MKKDLETRLREIPANVNSHFVREARSPRINPKEMWRQLPYLKLDLVDAITGYLRERGLEVGSSFSRELYSSQLNKEPLKRVHYGMLTARNVPLEVLKILDNKFEPLYLYSGIWNGAEVNEDNPIFLNVAATLYSGLNCLYKNHYKRKAKGIYSRDILPPRAHEIQEVYHKLKAEQERAILQIKEKQSAPKEEKRTEKQLYLL